MRRWRIVNDFDRSQLTAVDLRHDLEANALDAEAGRIVAHLVNRIFTTIIAEETRERDEQLNLQNEKNNEQHKC